MMRLMRALGTALALCGLVFSGAKAADTLDQEELLASARFSFERLATSDELPTARILMQKARAVMIFPNLLKGAFFLGGEGGSGVLLVRNADNSWSYPAFYTLGSISFGLQIGGQSSQAVLLVMNDGALDALLKDQVKLGGDLSAAIGPEGSGVEASATTSFGEDIYSYSTNSGLFVGASLEGAVIARREDWNGAFYNGVVAPREIVIEGRAANGKANPLRDSLANHASGR